MRHHFNLLTPGKGVCNHRPLKPSFVTYGSFRKILNSCGSSVSTLAGTIVELATTLGVTRRTLANWRKLPGTPEPTTNGSHSVAAWRDFVRANDLKEAMT